MIRVIRTGARHSDAELADLLQGLFALELLHPSSELLLVSAWVSDVEILDNRDGSFSGLDPNLPTRKLRLREILCRLVERGTETFVVANADIHNSTFLRALTADCLAMGRADRLHTCVTEDLHVKGLVADTFHLHGSMNFTYNGVHVLGEEVALHLDPNLVERARIDYRELYFSEFDRR